MSKHHFSCLLVFFAMVSLLPAAPDPEASKTAVKSLPLLEQEQLPFIRSVEIHGEDPKVIYIPIIHDSPANHVSSTNLDNCRDVLSECEQIAGLLHEQYGVSNILLEGCGKAVADHYNHPDRKGKKISFAHTKMITFEAWGNILNKNSWNLAATGERPEYGALTKLGSEYEARIQKALGTAKENGWFSTREVFVANQDDFQKLINEACGGYNEKRTKILENDPKLKKEYEISVDGRSLDFIESIEKQEGPGIIMCGVGHVHGIKSQLKEKGVSYMVIVPKSLAWPVKEKTEDEIYAAMLKQGCRLKSCSLKFGDGTGAKIKLPID